MLVERYSLQPFFTRLYSHRSAPGARERRHADDGATARCAGEVRARTLQEHRRGGEDCVNDQA